MNYFQIHKNKKPKKIKKEHFDYRKAKTKFIVSMGSVQVYSIKSQIFTHLDKKKLAITEQILNTANAIQNLWSPKQKYLDRINNRNLHV